jgi:hypothetical protein
LWENSTEFHRGSGSPKDQEKIQENAARPGKNTEELQRLVIREREREERQGERARDRQRGREADRQRQRVSFLHDYFISRWH